ncbi:hypothetical protein RHMOL_Rhmol05G0289100 [Rhododendron molle]|uniref:Uncharacterized protein n=1 Tax=Rhododendron molle TaxID=49168 RepID=A0ACC0NU87_RHOML|nr:hypothetical protein RHMOL_Rhmol05G0289100 [Rhododendron molle]
MASSQSSVAKVPFHVPIEIAIEILSRLPVKSLLRFKSVSKTCANDYKLIRIVSWVCSLDETFFVQTDMYEMGSNKWKLKCLRFLVTRLLMLWNMRFWDAIQKLFSMGLNIVRQLLQLSESRSSLDRSGDVKWDQPRMNAMCMRSQNVNCLTWYYKSPCVGAMFPVM